MSANLLDGVKPEITQYGSMTDGVITSSTPKANWKNVAIWPITTGKFAENQTMHLGISAKWHGKAATTGVAYAAVKYADAAGSTNNADIPISGITTEWKRFSLSAVIPSGMHIVDFHISGDKLDAAYDATNPVLSYGSAVCLASSAHTPYATQDHISVTYATKASLKVTDDSIKAEVSARAQTDRNVADLSSRLTQTANSLTSEISDRRSAITTVTGLANAAQSTADAAKTSASSAVSTANAASSTASAAKSTAQTAASDAATAKTNASSAVSTANAAKSTAQTASTNASNAVSTANSANSKSDSAVSTANSAKSTAASASSTANAAKSTVDGMKLGGRNLLKGTSMDVVTGTYPSSAYRDYLSYHTIDVPDGDTYTLSFDAKSTHAGDVIHCYFYSPNTTLTGTSSTGGSGIHPDGFLQVKLTDGWQRYWCTWTQSSTTKQKTVIPFRCEARRGSGTVSMRGVKLEAGNKATDWTPAPEDTDSAVADAKKAGTDAQTSANAAKTAAGNAQTTANTAATNAAKAQTMATENRSSIKQLSTSITAEVTARTKTDGMVSDLSSRLTQTADGFSASIDRLSDTDRKVNSWFGFGADSSGNPQLTMGSSSSPVVGVYTNTGLAYRSRSGATLLELDGASRSSTMPHVHADDVSMGSWQWVPTQNGTHFTLQWIGG